MGSKISLSLYLDEIGVSQDLLIFQPQEIDPDYVLNDPALRRQFLMTADDGLIPQSRINTLPYEVTDNFTYLTFMSGSRQELRGLQMK